LVAVPEAIYALLLMVLAPLLAVLLTSPPDGGDARIDAWLSVDGPVATGFSSPRGRRGVVLAMGAGRLLRADASGLEVVHTFYENHQKRVVTFRANGLTSLEVQAGEDVARGQRLGRGRSVELLVDEGPAEAFVPGRAALPAPQHEAVLVVVNVDGHRAELYERGKRVAVWEVGQGQVEGAKAELGDLKTPRGMYFVVERYAGAFTGPYAAYYSGHWLKLSYPNAFDAALGFEAGLVTSSQRDAIARSWRRRELTLQRTRLGGGIGFHGWNGAWDGADGGYLLSWGCLVLHPEELADFYRRVPLGAMVVLL
jgi:hypothetical protein